MIFSCQTKDLVSAVMTSIRCLAARTPMEILEKVYVDADEKGLTIAAADGAMASFTTVPATIVTDGVCLLPGRLLSEVARKLPEGEVKCSLSDKYVMTFTAGNVKINLSAMPADEYPLPAEEGYDSSLTLPQPLLKDMISKVAFTVPQEDQRLILTGGYLHIQNGRADLVGLDGYRMAMRSELISDTALAAKAVIPVRALEEIAKLMGEDEEKHAKISFNKSSVKVENGETVLYANLLNGEYIDYNRVIPKTAALKASERNSEADSYLFLSGHTLGGQVKIGSFCLKYPEYNRDFGAQAARKFLSVYPHRHCMSFLSPTGSSSHST